MVNMHAKFKFSSLNRSRDMEKSQNSKSRSRDPSRPLSPIFEFSSLVLIVVNMHAKFEFSSLNRFQDMKRVPKI